MLTALSVVGSPTIRTEVERRMVAGGSEFSARAFCGIVEADVSSSDVEAFEDDPEGPDRVFLYLDGGEERAAEFCVHRENVLPLALALLSAIAAHQRAFGPLATSTRAYGAEGES